MNTIQLSLFPDNQDFSVLSPNEVIRNVIYDRLQSLFSMDIYDCKDVMNNCLMTIWLGKPTISTIDFDKWLMAKHGYYDSISMLDFIALHYGQDALNSIQKHLC
jgi:hypothetical protein